MRKNHPAFRLGTAEAVRRSLRFLPGDDCLVAFVLSGHAGGDAWNNIIVVLNANKEPKVVEIPEGQFTVVCCDNVIDESGLGTIEGGRVTVDPQSALILHD